VSISGPEELEALRAAGAVVRRVLEAMKQQVRAGITTAQLDDIGAGHVRRRRPSTDFQEQTASASTKKQFMVFREAGCCRMATYSNLT
jgi:methionine aminopeptidase